MAVKRFVMKNFVLLQFIFVIMGVISFGILAILLRVLVAAFWCYLHFLVLALLIFLLIYQQKKVMKLMKWNKSSMWMIKQKIVWHHCLKECRLVVVKVDQTSGNVEWFSPYAELILTNEDGEFDVDLLQKLPKHHLRVLGRMQQLGIQNIRST